MGVLPQALLGCRDPDLAQQLDRPALCCRRVDLQMLAQRLDDLPADRQHRIERGHRILKHDGDRPAAQPAQRLGGDAAELPAVEQHPAGDPRAARCQLQDRPRQHCLARAGFADDTESATCFELEIDLVDRTQGTTQGRQVDRQPLDRKQGSAGHSAACRGSVAARSRSPTRLKASTVRNIAAAGKNAIDGAVSRLSRPSAIMPPQLGAGGGTPRPRKLSAPSTTMITATASRKKAISGNAMFGSSSRARIRPWPAPSARAAVTKSRPANDNVAARATRVRLGMLRMPRVIVMLRTDWPR